MDSNEISVSPSRCARNMSRNIIIGIATSFFLGIIVFVVVFVQQRNLASTSSLNSNVDATSSTTASINSGISTVKPSTEGWTKPNSGLRTEASMTLSDSSLAPEIMSSTGIVSYPTKEGLISPKEVEIIGVSNDISAANVIEINPSTKTFTSSDDFISSNAETDKPISKPGKWTTMLSAEASENLTRGSHSTAASEIENDTTSPDSTSSIFDTTNIHAAENSRMVDEIGISSNYGSQNTMTIDLSTSPPQTTRDISVISSTVGQPNFDASIITAGVYAPTDSSDDRFAFSATIQNIENAQTPSFETSTSTDGSTVLNKESVGDFSSESLSTADLLVSTIPLATAAQMSYRSDIGSQNIDIIVTEENSISPTATIVDNTEKTSGAAVDGVTEMTMPGFNTAGDSIAIADATISTSSIEGEYASMYNYIQPVSDKYLKYPTSIPLPVRSVVVPQNGYTPSSTLLNIISRHAPSPTLRTDTKYRTGIDDGLVTESDLETQTEWISSTEAFRDELRTEDSVALKHTSKSQIISLSPGSTTSSEGDSEKDVLKNKDIIETPYSTAYAIKYSTEETFEDATFPSNTPQSDASVSWSNRTVRGNADTTDEMLTPDATPSSVETVSKTESNGMTKNDDVQPFGTSAESERSILTTEKYVQNESKLIAIYDTDNTVASYESTASIQFLTSEPLETTALPDTFGPTEPARSAAFTGKSVPLTPTLHSNIKFRSSTSDNKLMTFDGTSTNRHPNVKTTTQTSSTVESTLDSSKNQISLAANSDDTSRFQAALVSNPVGPMLATTTNDITTSNGRSQSPSYKSKPQSNSHFQTSSSSLRMPISFANVSTSVINTGSPSTLSQKPSASTPRNLESQITPKARITDPSAVEDMSQQEVNRPKTSTLKTPGSTQQMLGSWPLIHTSSLVEIDIKTTKLPTHSPLTYDSSNQGHRSTELSLEYSTANLTEPFLSRSFSERTSKTTTIFNDAHSKPYKVNNSIATPFNNSSFFPSVVASNKPEEDDRDKALAHKPSVSSQNNADMASSNTEVTRRREATEPTRILVIESTLSTDSDDTFSNVPPTTTTTNVLYDLSVARLSGETETTSYESGFNSGVSTDESPQIEFTTELNTDIEWSWSGTHSTTVDSSYITQTVRPPLINETPPELFSNIHSSPNSFADSGKSLAPTANLESTHRPRVRDRTPGITEPDPTAEIEAANAIRETEPTHCNLTAEPSFVTVGSEPTPVASKIEPSLTTRETEPTTGLAFHRTELVMLKTDPPESEPTPEPPKYKSTPGLPLNIQPTHAMPKTEPTPVWPSNTAKSGGSPKAEPTPRLPVSVPPTVSTGMDLEYPKTEPKDDRTPEPHKGISTTKTTSTLTPTIQLTPVVLKTVSNLASSYIETSSETPEVLSTLEPYKVTPTSVLPIATTSSGPFPNLEPTAALPVPVPPPSTLAKGPESSELEPVPTLAKAQPTSGRTEAERALGSFDIDSGRNGYIDAEPSSESHGLFSERGSLASTRAVTTLPQQRCKGLCHVRHDSSCNILFTALRLERKSALKLCRDLGGRLASIQDRDHLGKVSGYVRNCRMRESARITLRLGMIYNATTDNVVSADGRLLEREKFSWSLDAPRQNCANCTEVLLQVEADGGMFFINSDSSDEELANICEVRHIDI